MNKPKPKPLPEKVAARLREALDAGKSRRVIMSELRVTAHQVGKARAELELERAVASQDIGRRAEVSVELIHVGSRIRNDYGDIAALARSIDANGLLHPVVVREGSATTAIDGTCYELIAGERRIRAWKESKNCGQPIPVRIVDIASIRRGEWAENSERKDFTPSEVVAIKRDLEIEFDLSGEAERRKRAGKKAAEGESGRVSDLAGAVAGRSGRTVEKAEAVVRAADEDPERFGKLKEQMDKSGKVDGPYKRLQNMRAGDALKAEPPPLPGKGPYRTIVIDPPWPADIDGERDIEGRGYYPYATMNLDQIEEINVPSIMHRDGCALWLWITNFHLARGCHVSLFDAWGFRGSTILTWCKPMMGQGQRLRGATEHVILAVRGNVPCLGADCSTWFGAHAPHDAHSGKPDAFYDVVQRVTPASRYAYLFAGRTLPDLWDGHGDRVEPAGNLDAFAERLGRPESAA